MEKNKTYLLVLEREQNKIWERVSINDNLLFDSARSLSVLKTKIKKAIKDFEGLENVKFEYGFDKT